MAMIPKQDHTEVPVLVGRRSTRLSVAVPIAVSGTDAEGSTFKEHTFTLNVNKHGAEIATSHLLIPDAEISIENISLGRKGLARVVQRRERRTPNSPYEVSVELLDPENIWGVRFPPADWDKDSVPKGNKTFQEKPAAAVSVAPPPDALECAPASDAPEGTVMPVTPDSQPALEGKAQVEPVASSEPAAAAGSAPAPTDGTPPEKKALEETAAGFSLGPVSQNSPPGPEASSSESPANSEPPKSAEDGSRPAPPGLDEKLAAARAAEEQLRELLQGYESMSSQLESLLAKLDGANQNLQSELATAREAVKEAGREAAQSRLEEFRARLFTEFEANSNRLLGETRQRLEEEVSASVAAFAKQAGAHLSKLTQESGPELEAKQKAAVNQAKNHIADAAGAATEEFEARLKKSAEEAAQSLGTQIKTSLEQSAAEQRNQLALSLRAEVEKKLGEPDGPIQNLRRQMQEESDAASSKFREACSAEADQASVRVARQLEENAEFVRKTADEATAGLWEAAKTIRHDLTFKGEKIRKQLADITSAAEQGFHNYTEVQMKGAQEEIQESFREVAAKSAQEFAEQLQKTADGILESSAPPLQRQAEDALELCRGTLESSTKQFLEEARGRLSQMARESAEGFSAEARSAGDEFTARLQSTLQDFMARSGQELETQLRKTGEKQQQAILAGIEAESRKTGERVIGEIKSRAEGVAKEASDTLYKQVGVATVVLKEWGDQASSRLEGQFRNSIDSFQRQVQELMATELEAHRRQSEEATREIRRRLEEATRILSAAIPEPPTEDPSHGSGA